MRRIFRDSSVRRFGQLGRSRQGSESPCLCSALACSASVSTSVKQMPAIEALEIAEKVCEVVVLIRYVEFQALNQVQT